MGFDNECILNIQSLAGEYFCPVCRTLVYPNEALQSQCTHLYCKPCLAYVVSSTQACPYDGYLVTEAGSKPLVESNKVLAETIGKIAVHCLYHRSGCPWQGPLSECTSHCSGCAFGNSPVVCNRCGIQIVHRQVQEHAQTCNVNGANPQAQQGTENVQDAATSGAAVTMDQSKSATQPGVPTTQSQASQTVVGTPSGQNPNQQAITNPQSQAVPPTAVPTPEQWYQQQYQQYYQQYPGYDPYQQAYQQYYPYQQQATQQFQQHPPHVQGQAQSQPLPQVQPQAQQQIQQQVQLPTQPQLQPQPHPHPQTQSLGQPQIPPQGHPQPNLYSQAAVPVQNQNQVQGNPQQQIHPAVQPHAQVQSQTLQPPHGLLPPQSFPQAQPHQVQTHPQQQMPQYQQHPQMHHSQPLSQVHPHPQVQPQPHSQGQPQPQFQPHAQPHPQLQPSQPNMLQTPNAQPPVQSVTSHPQYPQPQAHQQMQQAPLQQQPMQIHPSTGSLPPGQVHGQFPQPPAHVRPPPFLPNQHQPALLSSQGQAPSITPAQHVHPHNQQPGLPVNQRPVMHPVQLPAPQQYVQPPQAFTGQLSGPVQGQLPQPGHFAPQQSQLRPQGPQAMQQHPLGYVQQQQHPLGYVQQQQSVAHGIQPQQSQNYMGRPVMQNHGLQSQQFPQSSGSLGVAPQPRPPQFGSAQQSVNQNYVNVNNQMQTSSDHQFIQSGVPANGAVVERKGDQTSERSVDQQESQSPSQKKSEKDANGLAVDSIETRSETGLKSMNDEHKPGSEVEENYRQEALSKDEVSEVYQMKGVSGDPVITQRVKEEDKDSTLEHSPGGRSVQNKSVDERDASGDSLKQGEKSAVNVAVQASTQADKGSLVVPPGNSQASLTGRDRLQSSHPVPLTDQGRPQLPPLPYGPSGHQQRPAFPPMSQPVPPTGPPLGHGQLPHPGQVLNPPEHFQPPVLKQSGSFNPEHALGGPSVPGPIAPFGRGPNHFGNHPRSFELQSVAPQGQYNQGHFPSAHAGLSRMSQGEPVGPPVGAIPPGSFEPQDGIMGRALLPRGPEGQIGPHRAITPMETETFSNHRPPHFDGRLPESHVPGALERGPFGHSFGVESNAVRMNGAPGLDSSPGLALRNDKFKTLTEERLDTFPMGPPQRRDQSEVHEGLKQFPRSPHLGSEASPKFGNNFFSSRPMDRGGFGMDGPSRSLDKGPPGFNFDAGQKLDPVSGGGPSGFLPPYHSGGAFQPNNSGGRTLPVGIHDDNRGRSDPNRTNPDFLGPVSGFGRHHMDRVPPRSPGRQYLGNQSRPFGSLSGVPHNIDGIDGRDTHPFGEGSRSFNHASESVGHSRHESRFPILPPGHMQRGDFDGPGNLRMGEHMRSGDLIGQDILSSHLRRGEVFGPRNLPSHPHLGEPGFGSFPGYGRLGESGGGPGGFPHHESFGESFGNKSSHPRLGEPGFRSSYSLQGFPNDGRYFAGDSDSFDKLRKRKPVSSGWCRICKVDCETVEGLDIHGQTREHQKMAMDMVISIKQKNSKKQKTSNDHAAREDGSKSRNVGFQGRGNKP